MPTTPASVAKHPLHAILVAFPVALWTFSLVCDVVYRFVGGPIIWNEMAWYTMVAGIVGAVVAAVPGLIDFFSISDPRAGRIGLAHLIINVFLLILFSANAWLRASGALGSAPGATLPLALSIVGVGALLVSGWLGGEMIYVHKVGVAGAAREPSSGEKRSGRRAA
jgi:uncharacterized membrane protein